MTLLEYHRLKTEEVAARDPARLEATVRAERADFPEQVEALLPPPEERHLRRDGWPHYEKFHALCQLYSTSTPSQREYIRSQINWNRAFQLGHFRVQAKEIAVQTKSPDLVRLALVSLVINDFNSGDARDAILSMGSLLNTAREVDVDWSGLVQEVAGLAGPGMAPLLLDFLNNHPV